MWKSIPGYEGLYEANRQGQIRNSRTGKILKPIANPYTGYPHVNLYGGRTDGKRSKTIAIHMIIAGTFLGPTPEGMEIGHRNEKKDDPRLDNLFFTTHAENIKSAFHLRFVDRRNDGTFQKFN